MLEFVIEDMQRLYEQLRLPNLNARKLDDFQDKFEQLYGRVGSGTKLSSLFEQFETYRAMDYLVPPPLKKIDFIFSSNGNSYKGMAKITTIEDSKQICQRIRKAFFCQDTKQMICEGEQKTEEWKDFEIVELNHGLLFMIGKTPMIKLYHEVPYNVFLDFGEGGVPRRTLANYEQFETDIAKFIRTLNKVVNACYSKPTPDIKYTVYFL